MAVRGAGSITSPIIISDDENDTVVKYKIGVVDSDSSRLAGVEATRQNPGTPDVHSPSSVVQNVGYSMALHMGFRPGRGLGLQFDGKQICRWPLSLTSKPSRTS
ncbi:hypothetical protein BU15DRAFT_56301 [Melanogaster broomeanus]|nr:hypothetical protein BU15DRAFT_56301 [Melanogaster broomeanus]